MNKEERSETLIYVSSDNHFLDDSINDKKESFEKIEKKGNGSFIRYNNEINKAFFSQVIKEKPDVLILSGDLTYNGEKVSHERMAKFLSNVEKLGKTKVLVIPGNHDISNPWSREFKGEEQIPVENINKNDFVNIYGDFGYNEAISRDKESLSYLSKINDDLWILMLDSTMFSYNSMMPTTEGEIKVSTLKWLAEIGEKAKEEGVTLISSTHHNLYKHSSLIYKGYVLENVEEVIDTLEKANIKVNLSGHLPVQTKEKDENHHIYDIATGSLTSYPCQFGKIIYDRDNNKFTYEVSNVKVSDYAKDIGIEDENLLSFDTFQREYFEYFSKMQAVSLLNWGYNYLEKDDIDNMSDVFAILNADYFQGKPSEKFNEIIESEDFQLWRKNQTELSGYIWSFKYLEDYTHLEIEDFSDYKSK